MTHPYKVDFLFINEKTKWGVNKPLNDVDLRYNLEGLLVERFEQGYKLFQIIESKRVNPLTAQDESGLLVVFENQKLNNN